MKRLVLTAALAVAVLAGARTEAKAHGGYGYGFGVGFGINLSFSGWTFNPCNQGACSSGTCCIIPGWSPVYAPPTMYGGLQALQSYGNGGYPYHGDHHGGAGAAGANAGGKGGEKSPGKSIEKMPFPKQIEK